MRQGEDGTGEAWLGDAGHGGPPGGVTRERRAERWRWQGDAWLDRVAVWPGRRGRRRPALAGLGTGRPGMQWPGWAMRGAGTTGLGLAVQSEAVAWRDRARATGLGPAGIGQQGRGKPWAGSAG